MASDYDELTIQYEEDGQVVVEELEKVFLQKGTWTTVLYRYRQIDAKTGEWGPAKAALRRYQKTRGYFRKADSVNISEKSAPVLVEKLKEWFQV
ncbi:hypothetical protein AAU61_03850 [Desulfocarbo indianensis]|nr:hypothetical protein AAU61_03850 [Desulfocarbo indianensis]